MGRRVLPFFFLFSVFFTFLFLFHILKVPLQALFCNALSPIDIIGISLKGREIDGIRADVYYELETWLKKRWQDKPGIYEALKLNAWNEQLLFHVSLQDSEEVEKKFVLSEIAVRCAFESAIPYLEKKYGVEFPYFLELREAELEYAQILDEVNRDLKFIEARTFNNYRRYKILLEYSEKVGVSSNFAEVLERESISACSFLERVKKEMRRVGSLRKVDYHRLLTGMSEDGEEL